MSLLQFDAKTRQSSRRQDAHTAESSRRQDAPTAAQRRDRATWLKGLRAERARLTKALGVSVQALQANGERLYYHGDPLIEIEAAYRQNLNAGREAVLAALFEYHDTGYQTGVGDGEMVGARGGVR